MPTNPSPSLHGAKVHTCNTTPCRPLSMPATPVHVTALVCGWFAHSVAQTTGPVGMMYLTQPLPRLQDSTPPVVHPRALLDATTNKRHGVRTRRAIITHPSTDLQPLPSAQGQMRPPRSTMLQLPEVRGRLHLPAWPRQSTEETEARRGPPDLRAALSPREHHSPTQCGGCETLAISRRGLSCSGLSDSGAER